MTETIPLSSITKDSSLQMRAAMNEEAVARYEELIRGGEDFNPIVVYRVGKKLFVVDGFHRLEAFARAGAIEIEAEIRDGDKREAQFFSLKANADHGLNLTIEDKRKAAGVVFADAEWSKMSDRKIAKLIGASHTFVAKERRLLVGDATGESGNVATQAPTISTGNVATPAASEATFEPASEPQPTQTAVDAQAQREANIAQLPAEVRDRMAAADAARAGSTQPTDGETIGLSLEDRIAELEAENESLKANLAAKDDRLARLEPMETLFTEGGVDALLAAKDRVIESKDAMLRTQGDSLEKWKGECLSLRKRLNVEAPTASTVIDMQSGEVRNGVR